MEELKSPEKPDVVYGDGIIITLEGLEHIRRRPGMYIGKLGDGSHADDGIYVLLKEVIDNSIDEYRMGYGKSIEIRVENETVSVRDYGRGIPLNSVVKAVSIMNTGGKFDSQVFKKSVDSTAWAPKQSTPFRRISLWRVTAKANPKRLYSRKENWSQRKILKG